MLFWKRAESLKVGGTEAAQCQPLSPAYGEEQVGGGGYLLFQAVLGTEDMVQCEQQLGWFCDVGRAGNKRHFMLGRGFN